IVAVVLAAGKGTRLKSDLPKVLHEVCGRPMLAYVFDACRAAGVQRLIGVVGHGRDAVMAAFSQHEPPITWVTQEPQLGTGHAVMVCREHLRTADAVIVINGDGPLFRSETIRGLLERQAANGAAATLATAILDDPFGYGRILRDGEGRIYDIAEEPDATPEQRQIREINPGLYCFRGPDLLAALDRLRPNNRKNEYYLTDTIGVLLRDGRPVDAVPSVLPEDMYGINSRRDLALVNGLMRDRILGRLMDEGVTIVDPATTWIDARATIGRDTVIHPCTVINGAARIGANCRIGPFVHLDGGSVPDGATVTGTYGACGERP
ncbi:MAG: NTP transferase domain-containing protein, partial [Planctomycetota bacterium]